MEKYNKGLSFKSPVATLEDRAHTHTKSTGSSGTAVNTHFTHCLLIPLSLLCRESVWNRYLGILLVSYSTLLGILG